MLLPVNGGSVEEEAASAFFVACTALAAAIGPLPVQYDTTSRKLSRTHPLSVMQSS